MDNQATIQPRAGLSDRATKQRPVIKSTEETQLEFCFWSPLIKGTDKDKFVFDVKINTLIFHRYLYSQGFRRIKFASHNIFIQITNNRIVKRVEIVEMIDSVLDFVQNLPEYLTDNGLEFNRDLIEAKVTDKVNFLFNDLKLKTIRPKTPIEFNQDTLTCKYMYFLNGFLEINKAGINFKDYKTLENYIWDSEILKQNYIQVKSLPDKDYISRLVLNVCNGDAKRFEVLKNNIGYYMHNFTDYKIKSFLLTDSRMSEDDEPNGRTCKGLMARIIGGTMSNNTKDPTIKSYVEINGKNFDVKDKHRFSDADVDTKLIVINDLKKNFNVDHIYNDITEGIIVDKKGEAPFRIYAKLIIITNKTVKIDGESSIDRFVEFEFSDHYSSKFSPEDDFGLWLFRDFDNEDFCRYYYFMATCSHLFFKNGSKLIQPEQINLNARHLRDNTCKDFVQFMDQDWKPEFNVSYNKKDYFQKFIALYTDQDKPGFNQARFTLWLRTYIKYRDIYEPYDEKTNEHRENNGTRSFMFIKKK